MARILVVFLRIQRKSRKRWQAKVCDRTGHPVVYRTLAKTSDKSRTIPIEKRTWTDVEPGEYSLSDFEIPKKLIHLLRHGFQVHREGGGAVQFWRIKENLQKHFPYCPRWSDDKWKKRMAGGGGGNRKRYQYCADSSRKIVYLRALQGHSGRNLIVLLCRTML